MSEKQAFKVEYKGFTAEAFWGEGVDARIVITRPDKAIKELSYPAYKIFNIAAHWEDIVEGELVNSDEGWRIAGSDLLGGGVMPQEQSKRANPRQPHRRLSRAR